MNFLVSQATSRDAVEIAELCHLLWPDASPEEHLAGIQAVLDSGMYGTLPAAFFVARDEDGAMLGFIHAGMRSHADGCDVTQPAGFVEGWFVLEPARRHGIGTALMRKAEQWARNHGCKEMASDAWADHDASLHAHAVAGFEVVDRCVHFRKTL